MKYKIIIKANPNLAVLIHETIFTKQRMGVNVINLDEFESLGTHWVAFYVNDNNATYFDSVEKNIFQNKLKNS